MRKNIAGQHIGGQLIDATTGAAFTGSVTCYVTGDAGTQAVGSVSSGACAHEGNGFHTYNPAQAETNYDHIGFTFIGTGAVPATVQVFTSFPQTVDNAPNISAIKTKTDFLPSATAGAAGGVFIAGSNAATSITTALTANIIGNVTGNLSGSAGSVTADVGITQAAADKAWGTTTRVLTAGTNIALAKGTGVTGFNDLSAAQVNTEADTALSDVGLTTTITGRIDAAISTRLASAGYTAPPTVGAIADQVWDEIISGHAGVGSTGAALAAAGGSGDPWATALPGAYGAGTAGQIVGDYLDVAVSSISGGSGLDAAGVRAAIGLASANLDTQLGAIDDFLDTEVAAIKTDTAAIKLKTDNLPSDPADASDVATAFAAIDTAVGAVPTAVENADALLKRDWTSVTGEASHSMLNAGRFVRGEWSISGTTLTVFKEDGTTPAYTRTLTTDAAAVPITGAS